MKYYLFICYCLAAIATITQNNFVNKKKMLCPAPRRIYVKKKK